MTKTNQMPRRTLSFPPDVEKHFEKVIKRNKFRSHQIAFEAVVRTNIALVAADKINK